MVRDRLRATTHDVHEALHRAAAFADIADGTIGKSGYGALLRVLYRYHADMMAACIAGAAALAAPQLGAAQENRVGCLCDDLASLGLVAEGKTASAAGDSDFSVGCLYTVLGSTLGGKILHRQLESLLPDGRGRSFFKGTAEDSLNWQTFCAALETYGRDRPTARIEAGAHHAFRCFQDMLESQPA